ncbi:hypothetical protein JRO89_XSUnG0188100 [Xanthoceras sorbifolium]|uniref:Uncharacterized protein n=1 Tax=Xanthoceras sorbifolium TaxID=99658 RepID=A0ABQ8GZA5_9ROSI|nr:hypothetical protein JRO89_XSUnG0188100 [Xanthoceras sorbifolium]
MAWAMKCPCQEIWLCLKERWILLNFRNNNVENFEKGAGEGRVRMKECLVGIVRIGVVFSMQSRPTDRMEMIDVVKLCDA